MSIPEFSANAPPQANSVRIKVTEIFTSLQGESNTVGWPTVFVRLTGCPLRCHYCDTAYAFYGGQWMAVDAVLQEVESMSVRHVCVTGGEPLAQKGCLALLTELCDAGYEVSLETSGAMDITAVDNRVKRVIDVKTPDSGEQERNRLDNLKQLSTSDQLKFVLCSRADYDWAVAFVNEHRLFNRCDVLFSPSYEQLPARDLADWIVEDRLPIRFQLQLHKQLWGDEAGR